ncbi:TPA: hypothetical protein ACKP33_004074 [Serratia marcescens]|nr:hypothetical protein FG173_10145 [Serratia marcescens]
MTPDDIRLVVNEILPQYQASQWQIYLIALCIGGLIAAIGIYWGANLKKRGEINASEALFDKISDQLRQNTKDVETIKTALSGQHWVSQQTWVNKEKYYTGLITYLHDFIHAIDGQLDCVRSSISVHDETISDPEFYEEMQALGTKASEGLNDLRGPSLVFLSEKTNLALDQMLAELWNLREHSTGPRSEFLKGSYDILNRTIDIVLPEAKRELSQPLMKID